MQPNDYEAPSSSREVAVARVAYIDGADRALAELSDYLPPPIVAEVQASVRRSAATLWAQVTEGRADG